MMKQKGITLIALVMTIVVMLVLVGVTITTVINSDLIGKAKETGAQTKEMSEAEPGQADDLLNSAMGLVDNDIEILREFFGKGPAVVGWINDYLNANIEPIPDAPTAIKYLGWDTLGAYFAYNENIYKVNVEGYNYGEIIKKNYSDQFMTIALQGTAISFDENTTIVEHGISYCLNLNTGTVNGGSLEDWNGYEVVLYGYDRQKYDILNSYNPRLWIDGEEVTVPLAQSFGKDCIVLPAESAGKSYRAVITINGETLEVEGTINPNVYT